MQVPQTHANKQKTYSSNTFASIALLGSQTQSRVSSLYQHMTPLLWKIFLFTFVMVFFDA